MIIKVAKVNPYAIVPENFYEGDAGFDLCAAESGFVYSKETKVVKTGIAIEIPEGYAGFVLPRSGLAAKNSVTVVNSPGLIDSGYRGELMVILHKLNGNGGDIFSYGAGDRIAQLVIQKVETAKFINVDYEELTETERSEGGLGSSGK